MGGSEGIYQSNFFCFFIQIYHGIFNFSEIKSFLPLGGPLCLLGSLLSRLMTQNPKNSRFLLQGKKFRGVSMTPPINLVPYRLVQWHLNVLKAVFSVYLHQKWILFVISGTFWHQILGWEQNVASYLAISSRHCSAPPYPTPQRTVITLSMRLGRVVKSLI